MKIKVLQPILCQYYSAAKEYIDLFRVTFDEPFCVREDYAHRCLCLHRDSLNLEKPFLVIFYNAGDEELLETLRNGTDVKIIFEKYLTYTMAKKRAAEIATQLWSVLYPDQTRTADMNTVILCDYNETDKRFVVHNKNTIFAYVDFVKDTFVKGESVTRIKLNEHVISHDGKEMVSPDYNIDFTRLNLQLDAEASQDGVAADSAPAESVPVDNEPQNMVETGPDENDNESVLCEYYDNPDNFFE